MNKMNKKIPSDTDVILENLNKKNCNIVKIIELEHNYAKFLISVQIGTMGIWPYIEERIIVVNSIVWDEPGEYFNGILSISDSDKRVEVTGRYQSKTDTGWITILRKNLEIY